MDQIIDKFNMKIYTNKNYVEKKLIIWSAVLILQ